MGNGIDSAREKMSSQRLARLRHCPHPHYADSVAVRGWEGSAATLRDTGTSEQAPRKRLIPSRCSLIIGTCSHVLPSPFTDDGSGFSFSIPYYPLKTPATTADVESNVAQAVTNVGLKLLTISQYCI